MRGNRILCLLTCGMLLMSLSACGGGTANSRTTDDPTGVEAALQAGIEEANGRTAADRQSGLTAGAPEPTATAAGTASAAAEGIDIDLTALSSTMVYSEVYAMLYEPADYVGKTVKMGGQMASYHDDESGSSYYACIIQDATACCAQGIEFCLQDADAVYPEDGSEVLVSGVFDTYEEDGYTYCTLRDATIL